MCTLLLYMCLARPQHAAAGQILNEEPSKSPHCMTVSQVYPGPDGKARFEQQIRDLIQLNEQEDFDIAFECKAPDTGTSCSQVGLHPASCA